MPLDELQILPVKTKRDLKSFIKLPGELYHNDPHWVPPLYLERKGILHPKKNPYYQHATVQLFLAKKGGRLVGRISAQLDQEYERIHKERVGHFGFFECINDPSVAKALFFAAENFLKSRQATRILGPFSFSINEESGLLIEGFEEPLMIMMPYNPKYYQSLIEGLGYSKAKDLYSWKYQIGEVPEAPAQLAKSLSGRPGLTIRNINKRHIQEDLEIVLKLFNSVWKNNWGFVPFTPAEVKATARNLKLFIDPETAVIAEVNGKPAGICVSIPNFYEFIADLRGRILPLGIFKLLWRIKKRKCQSSRLMLFGIKEEYRAGELGPLGVLLYVKIHQRAKRQGYKFGELGWTLEDNHPINAGIEFMGGKRYKTYRIYEKKIA